MKSSLKDSHEIILNTLPQFVFIVTESGTYIEAFGNDTFTTTPGFDNKKLIGYSIYDLFDEQRAKNFSVLIHRAISSGEELLVKYGFTKGETFPIVGFPEVQSDVWYEGVIRPLDIEHNGEKTILWSVKNITQQISLENELRYLSETDELTGVTNRRSLMKMMQFSFQQAKTTNQVDTLLLLDVDNFKQVMTLMAIRLEIKFLNICHRSALITSEKTIYFVALAEKSLPFYYQILTKSWAFILRSDFD